MKPFEEPLDEIGPHCDERDLGPDVEAFIKAALDEAVSRGAGEVHIEAGEAVEVRHRIAGRLASSALSLPLERLVLVMAKIKIMTASMDISQRKLPQAGRFKATLRDRDFEVRVRTVPTIKGESCVLRLCERLSAPPALRDLGFLPDTEDAFRRLLAKLAARGQGGLILVCGPAGSGRSTTLYSCLAHLARPEIKLVSVDEEEAFELPGVSQMRVHSGLSYAEVLRQLLVIRPDAALLGYLGKAETAGLALKAARAGMAVLAAGYARDAAAGLSLLAFMGLPAWEISQAVVAVLAQRLAPRLCGLCRSGRAPTAEEAGQFSSQGLEAPRTLYESAGDASCRACGGSGRSGVAPVHELLVFSPGLRQALEAPSFEEAVRAEVRAAGIRTLAQDGLAKAAAGLIEVRELAALGLA